MRRTCARKKRLMILMYVRIAVFWRNRFIGAQGARLWPVIVTVYSHLIECVIESYCGMQRQFWPAQNFVASALPANCGQMACTAYQSTTLALEPILPMPIVSYHAARQNDTGKDQTRSKNTSKQAAKTQKKHDTSSYNNTIHPIDPDPLICPSEMRSFRPPPGWPMAAMYLTTSEPWLPDQ